MFTVPKCQIPVLKLWTSLLREQKKELHDKAKIKKILNKEV